MKMVTKGETFYGTSVIGSFTYNDVLDGLIIKISPALVTITDGFIKTTPPEILQEIVQDHVIELLEHKVRTIHVDVNFEDYRGFAKKSPDINVTIFTPSFLESLNEVIRSYKSFLTLHLLTNYPQRHFYRFERIEPGAICFQLDVISDSAQLKELIRHIRDIGACASPVIETVGSENLIPKPKEEVFTLLEPVLHEIGMLTFQAAGTASRSNVSAGTFDKEKVGSYVECFKERFSGTIQLQGGITPSTIREAVKLGAEFLVSGTQIFRNQKGLAPPDVIDIMLMEAAKALMM